MAELPEDWQNVPNEQEKSEEIKRLTVRTFLLVLRVDAHKCATLFLSQHRELLIAPTPESLHDKQTLNTSLRCLRT